MSRKWLAGVVMALAGFFLCTQVVMAATATVNGRFIESVVGTTTKYMSFADVKIIVQGSSGIDFPWATVATKTDWEGKFSVAVEYPAIPEIKVVAICTRTYSSPMLRGEASVVYSTAPSVTEINLPATTVQQFANGAVLSGSVKDVQTGAPLGECNVKVVTSSGKTIVLQTDGQGSYSDIVDLGAASVTATVSAPGATEEWKYTAVTHSGVPLAAGKIYPRDFTTALKEQLNFSLSKATTAAYIEGTVTDSTTKKAIPFAKVKIAKTGATYTAVTDSIGRFKQNVAAGTYTVTTYGAHTLTASRSAYAGQSKSSGAVTAGQIIQVNFQMVKK